MAKLSVEHHYIAANSNNDTLLVIPFSAKQPGNLNSEHQYHSLSSILLTLVFVLFLTTIPFLLQLGFPITNLYLQWHVHSDHNSPSLRICVWVWWNRTCLLSSKHELENLGNVCKGSASWSEYCFMDGFLKIIFFSALWQNEDIVPNAPSV